MSSSPRTDAGPGAVAHSAPGRGSITRKLTRQVAVIVAAVTVVLAALTVGFVHQILINDLDAQLNGVLGPDGGPGRGGHGGDALRIGGLPAGSIAYLADADGIHGSVVTQSGVAEVPAAETITALTGGRCDGEPETIRTGEGSYRTLCATRTDATLMVAIPMAGVNDLVREVILGELALFALAVGAAAIAVQRVVARTLRPLNELSVAATEVASLPLASGEVDLAVRVPTPADPDDEVGRVALGFNSMLDHVESSLQAREASESQVRQFVADASHELRNPLASIRGYAELTERRADQLPPDAAKAIERISQESSRMSRLVEDMLLLARMDNGQRAQPVPVDLVESTLTAVGDAQAAGHDHVWQLQLPDDEVIVQADPGQLHQVIANLLSNARKHTPAGTVVTTSVRSDGATATLQVSDNGAGIAPELLPHVFERFARADVSRAHTTEGSTGLGLAIVASLVNGMGGHVGVASEPGEGTTFTVTFPVGAAAQHDVPTN